MDCLRFSRADCDSFCLYFRAFFWHYISLVCVGRRHHHKHLGVRYAEHRKDLGNGMLLRIVVDDLHQFVEINYSANKSNGTD